MTARAWHVSQNKHPDTWGSPWGAVEATPHPASGAGPDAMPGVTVTWRGDKGRENAERLAAFPLLLAFLNEMGPVLANYAAECLNSGRIQSHADLMEMEGLRKRLVQKAGGAQ